MRRVIESNGRFDWQLAVTGEDVVASFHYPSEPSIYYSTENIANKVRDPSIYGLRPHEVVEHYHRRSQTDTSELELISKVAKALGDRPLREDVTSATRGSA